LPGRVAATIGLTTVATAVAIVLTEVLVRTFFPAFDPSGRVDFTHAVGERLMLGEPGTVLRQRKNTGDFDVTVRFNRHGLRDDKDVAEAAPDDIVVVGDSVAWGWGIEEGQRFSDVLATLTGRRVFNLAAPTDIAGYRDLLDLARGLGARIESVVLAVSMETDLKDYDAPERPIGQDDTRWEWRAWLERRSAAYLMLATVAHQTPPLKAVAVALGVITPNLEGIPRQAYSDAMVVSSARRVAALARRQSLFVVLIPSRALWVGDRRDVEDRIHRAFLAALAREGIDAIDLRPLLEAGGAPLSYHFAQDGHWNSRGHRLAAEAIARRLMAP